MRFLRNFNIYSVNTGDAVAVKRSESPLYLVSLDCD